MVLPIVRSITNRPLAASLRKPDAVMVPSGNANAAAALRRSGVSARTVSLAGITNLLRANYPGRTIQNAAVFVSGVPEFARLDFIELVDARTGIPEGIPDFVVRTLKRAKHQPIWIPELNFPACPNDIYDQMKPFMRGNKAV